VWVGGGWNDVRELWKMADFKRKVLYKFPYPGGENI
jgi:hypothetical protein